MTEKKSHADYVWFFNFFFCRGMWPFLAQNHKLFLSPLWAPVEATCYSPAPLKLMVCQSASSSEHGIKTACFCSPSCLKTQDISWFTSMVADWHYLFKRRLRTQWKSLKVFFFFVYFHLSPSETQRFSSMGWKDQAIRKNPIFLFLLKFFLLSSGKAALYSLI